MSSSSDDVIIDSYPPGFNALPSAPAIIILDHKFRVKYKWEHPQISANPIQDFNLLAWDISAGINTDVGEASITIQDHDAQLINANDNRAGSAIAAGDFMQISLGKNNATPWFFGICDEPTIRRGGNGQQHIIVKAIGYGITLAHRFVNIDYAQQLDDAGDTVESDNTAKISELIKRVLSDDDIVVLPPSDQNIVIDVEDIDIKIRKYKKYNRSQVAVISELANFANAIFGIDPNLRFFCHASNKPSDYTITNDLTLNLDVDKMMIIRNQSYDYTDSTVRGAFTSLIGTDVVQSTSLIADNKGTSSVDIGQTYDVFGFNMYTGSIDGIVRFYASKSVNTVNGTMYWYVMETHSAVFRIYDVLNRDDMPLDRADNVVAYGSISNLDTLLPVQNITRPIELKIDLPATETNRYIAFYHTDGINIKYKNAGPGFRYGTAYFQQQDTGSTGTIRLVIPSEQPVILKAQNTTLKHQQQEKEQVQNFRDAPNNQTATQVFEGVMDSAGRIRRTYTGIVTSIPPERPPVGQLYRIIDKHQQLDTHALCIGYDVGSNMDNNLNAISMSVDLEEWLEK